MLGLGAPLAVWWYDWQRTADRNFREWSSSTASAAQAGKREGACMSGSGAQTLSGNILTSLHPCMALGGPPGAPAQRLPPPGGESFPQYPSKRWRIDIHATPHEAIWDSCRSPPLSSVRVVLKSNRLAEDRSGLVTAEPIWEQSEPRSRRSDDLLFQMTAHETSLISPTSVLSLFCSLALLILAISFSRRVLPASSTHRTLCLHTWHTFDFLIHTLFEGSFLYHSFFSYQTLAAPSSDYPHPASLPAKPRPSWLGHGNRSYGPKHSDHASALLWREYALADYRWAGADATVVSIELLTVLVAGPLAAYICYLLGVGRPTPAQQTRKWLLMIVLATGEIYGGFMTFAPEWLTGCANLETEGSLHLWVYLVFFNGLWVVLPGWVIWEAWGEVRGAFERVGHEGGREGRKTR
ncbi:MAG: hypothetical protein LQ345_001633 [Seirophora villosa]|nr:MAG: hypothetical protein LQ345_001633 [Seirophora villosa]